ncbi:histidinol-phosphatase [Chloroflexota bacterium]
MNIEPILYESHMHTPLCNHASGYPEEYAAVAQKRGLKGIIVTCHNPTNDGWSPITRMRLAEFEDYVAMVAQARQTWADQVDVRLGLESDYVPEVEPWLEQLHSRAEFHHILGSVHPTLPDYQNRYLNGDIVAFQRTYFEHLAMAAETGLFDTLSHPDLVKIVEPSAWKIERLLDTIRHALDRIAATGIAMELNTSGLTKRLPEMNPGRPILEEMVQRNIPVVLGADAHTPERVAANYEEALDTLIDVGYTKINIFLNRERQELDIHAARRSLRSV